MIGNEKGVMAMVAAGAIVFGFLGVPIRALNGFGMSAMEIALVRLGLTTLGIIAVAIATDRSAFRVGSMKDLLLFILIGFFKFMSDVTYLNAQISIELSLATLLQMTAPYYVLAFSFFLFKEKVTAKKVFAVLIAFVGCVLVTGVLTGGTEGMNLFGIVCAMLSGLFYSVYIVGCKISSNHGHHPTTTMIYVFLTASLLTIPFANVPHVAGMFLQLDSLMYILLLVFVMTLIPYYIEMWGVEKLSPNIVTMIAMLELVTACFVGFVFFDEVLSPLNILGMCLIVASIIVMDLRFKRKYRAYKERNTETA